MRTDCFDRQVETCIPQWILDFELIPNKAGCKKSNLFLNMGPSTKLCICHPSQTLLTRPSWSWSSLSRWALMAGCWFLGDMRYLPLGFTAVFGEANVPPVCVGQVAGANCASVCGYTMRYSFIASAQQTMDEKKIPHEKKKNVHFFFPLRRPGNMAVVEQGVAICCGRRRICAQGPWQRWADAIHPPTTFSLL